MDQITTPEEIKKLKEESQEKDDILEDWHTQPGSPWERSEDQTIDTTSLSWETEEIQLQTPTSWDEGEETTKETKERTVTKEAPKTEGPADDTESDNSLPELVSDDAETRADDSGYAFLNTPQSTEEEDANTEEEEKEKKKQAMYKEIDRIDEEARMQELTVDFILNMDDPNYKPPTSCLTGEQYYID